MPAMHRTFTLSPSSRQAFALTDSVSTTGSFTMGFAAGGLLYRVSGGTQTAGDVTLRFSVDPLDNGTNYLLVDALGVPVEVIIGQGECAPLPDGLFAAGKVYITTATGQTTSVLITEKS